MSDSEKGIVLSTHPDSPHNCRLCMHEKLQIFVDGREVYASFVDQIAGAVTGFYVDEMYTWNVASDSSTTRWEVREDLQEQTMTGTVTIQVAGIPLAEWVSSLSEGRRKHWLG